MGVRSEYIDTIRYWKNNCVVSFKVIDEDLVEYCIDTYYNEEFGNTFIIYTIVEPLDEFNKACKNISRQLKINIVCKKFEGSN